LAAENARNRFPTASWIVFFKMIRAQSPRATWLEGNTFGAVMEGENRMPHFEIDGLGGRG